MRIEHFRYLFNRINGFYLKKNVIMFRKPIEIWNEETGESNVFKTVEEALEFVIDGEKVADIILKYETLYIPPINGGRGAGNQKTQSWRDASGGKGSQERLLPAYANTKIKSKSLEGALAEFRSKHLDPEKEWAYEVDENGYVHQYVKGDKSSVGISTSYNVRNRSTMIIHNHPNNSAFSPSDMIATAMDRKSKGIIASGKTYDYIFKKGTHFKANEFIKAVKQAEKSGIKGKDINDAVDKWLSKNQKKYGYVYSRKKN